MTNVSAKHLDLLVQTSTALECLKQLKERDISVDYSLQAVGPDFFRVLLKAGDEKKILQTIENKYKELLDVLNVNLENCKNAVDSKDAKKTGGEQSESGTGVVTIGSSQMGGNAATILKVFAGLLAAAGAHYYPEHLEYFTERCSFTKDFIEDLAGPAYDTFKTKVQEWIENIDPRDTSEETSNFEEICFENSSNCLFGILMEVLVQLQKMGNLRTFQGALVTGVLGIAMVLIRQTRLALDGDVYELPDLSGPYDFKPWRFLDQ